MLDKLCSLHPTLNLIPFPRLFSCAVYPFLHIDTHLLNDDDDVYYPRAKGQGVNPYSKADHKQDPSDSNSQMWLIDTIKPRAIHLLLIRILHTSAKAPSFSLALALKLLLRLLVQTSSSPECTEADPCLGISVPPSRASTSHVDVPW